MTPRNPSFRRGAGATLLKISQRLFTAELLSTVVQPTIADLQREMDDAGHSRVERLRARWRGYRAFWAVVLVAPFAASARPRASEDAVARPDAITRVAVASIVLTLLGAAGPALSGWAMITGAAGTLVAVLIHRWYARHPSRIPAPSARQIWSPQINFSSMEVASNIGGLIFVVGSVFIVVIGVPSVIWFLFAATAAGGVLAWGLIGWHTRHPKYGLPANRIVCR
jgi:hypothetical protein